MNPRKTVRLAQSGSALIISLLVLMMLSLITSTLASQSVLQLKMAANLSHYDQQYYFAEAGIRRLQRDLLADKKAGYRLIKSLAPCDETDRYQQQYSFTPSGGATIEACLNGNTSRSSDSSSANGRYRVKVTSIGTLNQLHSTTEVTRILVIN